MLELSAGDYWLVLEPERGGSVARFEWRSQPLMRATCGTGILDTACFPMVPFSNRIACGHFQFEGREVTIQPNCPDADPVNPLHGFGWHSAWSIATHDSAHATLVHDYPGGEWPWAYQATQEFILSAKGLTIGMSLTNLGGDAMPAGLGLHPYFLRESGTIYHGLHHDEWQDTNECLPSSRDTREAAIDWWQGLPVGARNIDTAYGRREGDLTITWPERRQALTIEACPSLPHTVVYVPAGEDHFCVEPVSHVIGAINREHDMVRLLPGATMTATVTMQAYEIR